MRAGAEHIVDEEEAKSPEFPVEDLTSVLAPDANVCLPKPDLFEQLSAPPQSRLSADAVQMAPTVETVPPGDTGGQVENEPVQTTGEKLPEDTPVGRARGGERAAAAERPGGLTAVSREVRGGAPRRAHRRVARGA